MKATHTYARAVFDGHYAQNTGGLAGKHDNVRRYWEDDLTRNFLRPWIVELVNAKRAACERLRIIDLGCGTGQGYELLRSISLPEPHYLQERIHVLPEEVIGEYVGVDVVEAMVDQAQAIYDGKQKVRFEQGDLSQGLLHDPALYGGYDLYFSSYSSLSHLTGDQLEQVMCDIAQLIEAPAYLMLDLLGRWSYEWTCYWDRVPEAGDEMLEYNMDWLSPHNGSLSEHKRPTAVFPMRFWTRPELDDLVARVESRTGARVTLEATMDRSIFVGRHMDTRCYNSYARPVRRAVNHLHEPNIRTNLQKLLVDYRPTTGCEAQNNFFEQLQMAWNTVVRYCEERLAVAAELVGRTTTVPEAMPEPLGGALRTIDRVIENVGWMEMGDPRANIIEPQLGYVLRSLEEKLQRGMGCGHALLGLVRFLPQ